MANRIINAPGVDVFERQVPPAIEGVSAEVAGFVGIAERGPDDLSLLATSFPEFTRLYGSFFEGNFLAYAARDFFLRGGRFLYVGRVVGAGAAKASGDIDGFEDSNPTLNVTARWKGEWANNIEIFVPSQSTTLTAGAASGTDELTVTSVGGFQPGDYIKVDDGSVQEYFYVVAVDVATKKLRLHTAIVVVAGFAAGTVVTTTSKHRARTTLRAAYTQGSGMLVLNNTSSLKIGDLIVFYSGTLASHVLVEARVTAVNGYNVQITELNTDIAGAATTVAVDAFCTTLAFNLSVVEGGNVVEVHEYLSLETENKADYVDNRLTGETNPSIYVDAADAGHAAGAFRASIYPTSDILVPSGGLDGVAPTDADYLGTNTLVPNIHGLKMFDVVDAISMIAIPGVTTAAVLKGLNEYVVDRGDSIAIMDAPQAADSIEELKDFRLNTLGVDSSYAALYAPWEIEQDPEIADQTLQLPPSGRIAGIYADVSNTRGVNKAPANELMGDEVIGLVANFSRLDQEQVNELGINLIRIFPGRQIRVYGARTLTGLRDGRQFVSTRRFLNYVKESVQEYAERFVFEPISESLWNEIAGAINQFLRRLWLGGQLFPSTNFQQAAYVKVDRETNPDSVVNAGKVKGVVGVRPAPPAEQIIFEFALFSGGGSTAEL